MNIQKQLKKVDQNNYHRNHTRTVSRVEGELVDGKSSIACFPLQHQTEGLPHVHRHLVGATR